MLHERSLSKRAIHSKCCVYAILEKGKTTEGGKRTVVSRSEGVKGCEYEPEKHRMYRAVRTDDIG